MQVIRRTAMFCFLLAVIGGCVRTEGETDSPQLDDTTPDPPANPAPLTVAAPAPAQAEATGPLTTVTLGTATASGGSGTPGVSNDAPAGGFAVGVTAVVWTATDDTGARATATQTVTVTDTTAPAVTAPSNVSATATGPMTLVVLGQAVAVDLVDGPLTAASDAPANGFAIGTHTVTWTAVDAAGNSGSATQTVTIDPPPAVVGDAVNGAALYAQNCSGCHGADPALNLGNILNGDAPAAIVAAIQTVPAMANLAAIGADPQATADLAAYIAEVKATIPPVGNIDAGRIAYQQNCSGCHGDDLSLNRSNILNGDTVPSIENALQTVPSMATLAGLLGQPQTLADLAAFIADEKARADGGSGGIGLIPSPASCAATPPGPVDTVVRRLTRFEYRNTIADLLGVDIGDQLDLLPIETRPAGFSNDALSLIVTFEHIDGYNKLATTVTDRIGDPSLLTGAYADCTDATDSCYDSYIANLGERLFRAPLAATEIAELRKPFAAAAAEGDGYGDGAMLVLRAMLQSPRFLYRTELQTGAGSRQLDSYEIAARLSYLIWASAPDETLLASARNDALQSESEILGAADRLLADPRARRVTAQLVSEWFDLDLVASLDRNAIDHPEFTAGIAADMQDEAMTLFEQIIWEQQAPLISAYNSVTTYATQALADFYGLGAPIGTLGNGTNIYTLDAAAERAGLLTQGAVAAVSGGRDASLVQRGLFVLNRVMCSSVQQPPAGLDTTPPDVLPGEPARAHSEARVANPVCGGCHYQIDPLGWPFERLDAVAQNRADDDQGNPLSSAGVYEEPGVGPVPYADSRAFVDALVASPTVQDCIVVKPAQFAFGRAFEPAASGDGCFLSDIRERASGSTATYHDLVRAIVASEAFRSVSAE